MTPDATAPTSDNGSQLEGGPGSTGTRRNDLIAVAAIVFVVGISGGFRWYFDNWLSDFDILTAFLPWFGYIGDRLADFNAPGWYRFDAGGYSMAGSPSSGWMYLPVMLVFPFFQVLTAFKVMVIVQALIGGLAMYAFLRRIGLVAIAAFGGAILVAIGPTFYASTLLIPVVGQVAPFIAVGLLATEMAISRQRTLPFIAWTSLAGLAASQMFVAWPGQGFVYGMMYVGGWAIYRTVVDNATTIRQRIGKLVIFAGTAGIFAFGLGAASILPQLQFIQQSSISSGDYSGVRGGDYVAFTWSWAEIFSHHLRDIFLDRDDMLGYSVLILVAVALTCAGRRFGVPFFALIVFLLTDLSSDPSLTRWLFYLVPPFETLHSHRPTGSIAFVAPGFAVLAAVAIQFVLTGDGRHAMRRLIAPVVLIGSMATVMVIAGYGFDWWPLLIGLLTLAFVAAPSLGRYLPALPGWAPVTRISAVGIIITLLLYPSITDFTRSLVDPSGRPEWQNLLTRDASVEGLVTGSMSRSDPGGAGEVLKNAQWSETPFRYVAYLGDTTPDDNYLPSSERRMDIFVYSALANGRASRLGLEQVSGYNPVHLKYYTEYFAVMNGTDQDYHWFDLFTGGVDGNQLLDMLNARYILIPANLEATPPVAAAGTEVFRNQYVIVYRNDAAFERAWLVHDLRPNNDGEGLQLLRDGTVDGHVTAFVDGEIPAFSALQAEAADTVTIVDRSAEKLIFTASSTQPGLAVISQAYEEGWVAYVDGKRTNILRTNHALMGVPLAAGDHRVELRYEPDSITVGLWITGVTGGGMLIVWLLALVTSVGRARGASNRPAVKSSSNPAQAHPATGESDIGTITGYAPAEKRHASPTESGRLHNVGEV